MAADQDQSFNYTPLSVTGDEIRLITSLKKRDDGPIELELQQCKFDQANYRAVSYTWGKETPVHQIYINGQQASVRTNIHDFLIHRVAVNEEFIPIWIDAICIDQKNNTEKSEQVRMMNEIFGRAKVVLIWLGEKSKTCYMIDLYHVHQKKHKHKIAVDDWFKQIFKTGNSPCNLCRKLSWDWFQMNFKEAWRTEMEDIDYDRYWTRLWIVQEIISGRWSTKMILGSTDTVSIEVFFNTGRSWKVRSPIPRYNENLLELLTLYRKKDPVWGSSHYLTTGSLSSAIECCAKQKCSDRRDMIFGLLSMTGSAAGFKIDYTMSIGRLLYETLKVYCQEQLDSERIIGRDEQGEPALRSAGTPGHARDLRSFGSLFQALQLTLQDVIECYSYQQEDAAIDILSYRYNWRPLSKRLYSFSRAGHPLYELHDKLGPCISFTLEKSHNQSFSTQNTALVGKTYTSINLGPSPDHEILVLAYDIDPRNPSNPITLPKTESCLQQEYLTTEFNLDFEEWTCSFLMNELPNSEGSTLLGLCCSFTWRSGPHHMRVYLTIKLCSALTSAFEKQFREKDQKSTRSRRERVHGQIACCLYEIGWFWEIDRIFKDILGKVKKAAEEPTQSGDAGGANTTAANDLKKIVEELKLELRRILPQHSVRSAQDLSQTEQDSMYTCVPCKDGFRDNGFFESEEENDTRPVFQITGVHRTRHQQ